MGAATSEGGRALPRAIAVVPARLASTRLPRKMLRRDTGRFLFEHTVRNALASSALERVLLATDSEEILEAAASVGIEALSTSPSHRSGTDRVREACLALGREMDGIEVIVNVQGDEPELPPEALAELVRTFEDPEVELATLWTPLAEDAELQDPNTVKVVCDAHGWALYFSRAPIPFAGHEGHVGAAAVTARRHVGVYAFRPAALERFCTLPPSPLERHESLEQLRWLEAGGRILCVRADRVPRDINTEEHYREFVRRARRSAGSEDDPALPRPLPTRS